MTTDREEEKKKTTPGELAVLFMEAACQNSEQEHEALERLAEFLQIDLERLLAELMFLRTFAVELAASIGLGHSPARGALMEQFYGHWERAAQVSETELVEDLRARLEYYGEAVGEEGVGGMGQSLGQAFAAFFGGEAAGQLALLGGRMFGAFYEEVAQTLAAVEIVVHEAEED